MMGKLCSISAKLRGGLKGKSTGKGICFLFERFLRLSMLLKFQVLNMGSENEQKYMQHTTDNGVKTSNVHEDLPLSTAYNLNPIIDQDVKTKTFIDIHGKTLLVAGSGILAAIVTLALIIDIIVGSAAVSRALSSELINI